MVLSSGNLPDIQKKDKGVFGGGDMGVGGGGGGGGGGGIAMKENRGWYISPSSPPTTRKISAKQRYLSVARYVAGQSTSLTHK